MNDFKDAEYIFWLKNWSDSTFPGSWLKLGRFKCVISNNKIKVTSIPNDPDKELFVDMSLIQKCGIFHGAQYPQRAVELLLSDRKIILFPVNPFEPNPILHVNHDETSAMISVINAFRSDVDPDIDPNPYLRQLATKDNLKSFKKPNIQWDKHTSPWIYNELYGNKFLWLKVIAFMLFLVVAGVVLILAIAYVLDVLNII